MIVATRCPQGDAAAHQVLGGGFTTEINSETVFDTQPHAGGLLGRGAPSDRLRPGNDQLRQCQRACHRSPGRRDPGAQVSARQTDTNVTRRPSPIRRDVSGSPISRLARTSQSSGSRVQRPTRSLRLTVGSAFDLPLSLASPESTRASPSPAKRRFSKRREARLQERCNR